MLIATTFELAVHLRTERHPHRLNLLINLSGGLVHKTRAMAIKAARAIATDADVEWVNVSKITKQSIMRVRRPARHHSNGDYALFDRQPLLPQYCGGVRPAGAKSGSCEPLLSGFRGLFWPSL